MTEEPRQVYLVHTDSEVLLTLCDVLSAAGFHVSASSDVENALVHIGRSKPDVILCRWSMPQMLGPEFISQAKKVSPESKVILCSEHADGPMYDEAIRLGGSDVLREPLSSLLVLQVVLRSTGLGVPYEPMERVRVFDLDAPGNK